MLGDALSSVGIIIGAVAISMTGAQWIDPLLSVLIGVLILLERMGHDSRVDQHPVGRTSEWYEA